MISLTYAATAQVAALERFYSECERPIAVRNLVQALMDASDFITRSPERGALAPRPYPDLAAIGFQWVKRGRYWIAYDATVPTIAGVFFETDDIPSRF